MSSQAVDFNRLHIFERNGGVQNLCILWHRGEYHLTCARTKVLVKADLSQIFGRNSVQLIVEMAKKRTTGWSTKRLMAKVANSYLGLRLGCRTGAMVGHWKGLGNRLKCEWLWEGQVRWATKYYKYGSYGMNVKQYSATTLCKYRWCSIVGIK